MVTSQRLWQIAKGTLAFACLPLMLVCSPVLCLQHYLYLRHQKKLKKKQRPAWPIPFDYLDPRSNDSVLTLPLESVSGMTFQKATAAQADCLLLMMLPRELRDMIWEECLGRKAFHLTFTKSFGKDPIKLASMLCRNFGSVDHQECLGRWTIQDATLNNRAPSNSDEKYHHIKVLLTCRKIYSEAVPYLYKSNKFMTVSSVVEHLPNLMVPARWDSIRTLHFRYGMYECQPMIDQSGSGRVNAHHFAALSRKWVDVWGAVAKMKGLQDLRARIETSWHQHRGIWVLQAKAMEAIMKVKRPSRFVLVLPCDVVLDKSSGPVEALPFTVQVASTFHDDPTTFYQPYTAVYPN